MNVARTLTVFALVSVLAGARADAQIAGTSRLSSSSGDLSVVALGYRASKLLHSAVYNADGTRIGELSDMVVTPRSFVSYFVVAVGGFLGIGRKDVAVPARAFAIVNNKVVLPGATKKELESLPAFRFSRL